MTIWRQVPLVLVLLLIPAVSASSPREISRLATLLEQASQDLLLSAQHYIGTGSVTHNAARLEEKAQRLKDSTSRGRSSAYLRLRFTDVTRHLQRLEDSFRRETGYAGAPGLQNSFNELAAVYDELRYQLYGDSRHRGLQIGPPILFLPPGTANRQQYRRGSDLGLTAQPSGGVRGGGGSVRHAAPVTSRNNGTDRSGRHTSPVLERQRHRDSGRRGTDNTATDPLKANQGIERLSGQDFRLRP